MQSNIEVGLSVDGSGAVEGTQKAQSAMEDLDDVLRDVAEAGSASRLSINEITSSTADLSPKITDARQSLERMSDSASEAGSDSARLADRIQSISGVTDTAEASLRDLSQAQMRAQGATGSLGTTASSTASQLSVDLTQSAQDAAFGIENLAASAPFLMEQFTRLKQQAGSTSGAFGQLFSALKGPTGLITAFTLLLTFKDEIVGFFTAAGDSAEEAAGKVDRLKSAAEELITVDLGLETRDIESLSDARRLVEEMNAEITEIQGLQALKETLPDLSDELAAGVSIEQIGSVRTLLADTALTIEDLKEAAEGRNDPLKAMVDLVEEELDGRGKALENLKAQRDTLETSIKEAETLRSVYERLPDDLRKSKEEARGVEQAIAEAAEVLQRTQLPEGSPLQGQIGPEDGFSMPGLSTEDFRTETVEQLEGTIQGLESGLQNMDLSSNLEQETRKVVDSLKRMKEEMMLARGEAIDLGPALERGLASAIGAAAQAVGEGENVAKAILTTLANLAQRVGQMLIGFGTSMLALESIITNPVGAIAAGSALVALGAAAKNAISEQFDDATEGRSRDTRRDQIPGGGRVTGEVDVPGRRRGGPVEAGQLYQTHGLGEREFFMPAADGAIVTEQAIRAAAGSSSRRRVDVRTDHNVNLDVTEPDLFELRARLNELENSVSQLR